MIASAPGKLVLSGAYAVLRGAPAIVSAVDRRVFVDTGRAASFQTPEVAAGLEIFGLSGRPHPHFDATALRDGERKLGLGSSAAICAASLFALWCVDQPAAQSAGDWAQTIFPVALRAHRKAQGGGSGIDVAAACFGGTFEATLDVSSPDPLPLITKATLPEGLVFEVWASDQAASTADFVRRVFEREKAPGFATAFARQFAASRLAVDAMRIGDSRHFVAALRTQFTALWELGTLCEVDIVLPKIESLHASLDMHACFLPSGAGGGDITLYIGHEPSSAGFRQQAEGSHLRRVELSFGAPGLRIDEGWA